jgi:GntR family transcriptional regulator
MSEQVTSILRQRFFDGDYDTNRKLSSESDLAAEFGISRATIRMALAALEAEGYLVRRQGDGTYLRKRVTRIDQNVNSLEDFASRIELNGNAPTIETLSVVRRSTHEVEAQALEISSDEDVLSMTRLFRADSEPVILSTNVMPASLLPFDFDSHQEPLPPIRELLQSCCNQDISFAITSINATIATPRIAQPMGVKPGAGLFKFVEVFYNDKELPLVYAENYSDGSYFTLQAVRTWR